MTFLVFAGLGAYALAALCGAWRPQAPLSAALSLVGGLACAGGAIGRLAGATVQIRFALGPPPFALQFGLPPLSALFVVLISAVGALASVYGGGYVSHLSGPHRRSVLFFGPAFLASMTLVAMAGDLVAFIVAWEAMSLTSYALVMTESDRPEVLRAGYIYLVMTHAGAACLLAAFVLLANATGSMDFTAWARAAPHLAGGLRSAIFVLILLGFGSKAALVPLHVWLPRAHPVAPSHVSGLMSGVMLKMAVYGFILITFTVLRAGPYWWGLLMAGLGMCSAVLGILYALMEHDLKRLLAYSSVENIGIVTMGLGVALLGQRAHLPMLSAVALVAALYHTVNHALFKTALFLGAGSIQYAGVGRHLDRMGGLVARMPWTAVSMMVAAASISGLPPFNGFISEWLTYQSLLRLAAQGGPLLALCGFAGILVLALSGGLAAACFVKVCGVGFLGRPRTDRAAAAREVPAALYGPALALAATCMCLGLLPGILIRPLLGVVSTVLGQGAALPGVTSSAVLLALPWGGAHLAPLPLLAMGLAAALGTGVVLAVGRRWRPGSEVRAPWACGGVLGPQSDSSATSYANPFRQVFGLIYRPVRSVRIETVVHPFFRARVEYAGAITPIFDRYGYAPLVAGAIAAARFGRRLQSGSLRLYLGYMLVTLILLLALVH